MNKSKKVYARLSKAALVILIIAFLLPILGVVVASQSEADVNGEKWGVITAIFVGMYNIPIIVGALILLYLGTYWTTKPTKQTSAKIALTTSSLISIASLIFVGSWVIGLGT